MPLRARLPGPLLVVEGFTVDRVDAPELQPPLVDAARHVLDDLEVLPLIEAAHRGGIHENGRAALSEHEQFHIALERGTPPLAVVALHILLFSMSAHAVFAPRQPPRVTSSCSSVLYDPKNVSISRSQCFGRSASS